MCKGDIRRVLSHEVSIKVITFAIVLVLSMTVLSVFISPADGHKTDVHEELTYKTLETFYEDDKGHIPDWLETLDVRRHFVDGAYHADQWDLSRNHYYNPHTGEGLSGFQDARSRFVEKVRDARNSIEDGEVRDSMNDLGWALHILQDMTIPHHVHNEVGDGHSGYEDWIRDNMDVGDEIGGGNYSYDEDIEPGEWIHNTALYTYDYYEYVADSENASEENYTYAWENLQPFAIQQGAGFVHWFFESYVNEVYFEVTSRGSNSIDIRWTEDFSEGFEQYEIYIAENETALEEQMIERDYDKSISSRHMTSYTFSGLEQNTEYHINIRYVREDTHDIETGSRTVSTIISPTFIALILLFIAGTIFVTVYKSDEIKRKTRKVRE